MPFSPAVAVLSFPPQSSFPIVDHSEKITSSFLTSPSDRELLALARARELAVAHPTWSLCSSNSSTSSSLCVVRRSPLPLRDPSLSCLPRGEDRPTPVGKEMEEDLHRPKDRARAPFSRSLVTYVFALPRNHLHQCRTSRCPDRVRVLWVWRGQPSPASWRERARLADHAPPLLLCDLFPRRNACWELYCLEHGLGPDGRIIDPCVRFLAPWAKDERG